MIEYRHNDTDYTNVDDLTVTTLKGGVYMKYKNDASFVFGQDLYMFEQQSSRNPNMPLRFLHYLDEFHNSNNKVSSYNTNPFTFSSEFLSKCETLKDYMTFVNKVRVKTDVEKIDIRTAVTEAVDEYIAENVLSEFFRNHREEVITVSIYEYDEEGHLEIVKEEGRQLGIAEGRQLGLNECKQLGLTEGLNKGINTFIKLCKDMHLSDDDTVNKLIEDYQLSKDEAVKAVKNYY